MSAVVQSSHPSLRRSNFPRTVSAVTLTHPRCLRHPFGWIRFTNTHPPGSGSLRQQLPPSARPGSLPGQQDLGPAYKAPVEAMALCDDVGDNRAGLQQQKVPCRALLYYCTAVGRSAKKNLLAVVNKKQPKPTTQQSNSINQQR